MSSHLVRVYSSTSRLAPLGQVFGGRLPVSHKATQHTLPHPTVEIVKKKKETARLTKLKTCNATSHGNSLKKSLLKSGSILRERESASCSARWGIRRFRNLERRRGGREVYWDRMVCGVGVDGDGLGSGRCAFAFASSSWDSVSVLVFALP